MKISWIIVDQLFIYFRPLVGTALNTPGRLVFGLFLAISGYFIFNNYIANPEFYKTLQISREASKVNSHAHSAG